MTPFNRQGEAQMSGMIIDIAVLPALVAGLLSVLALTFVRSAGVETPLSAACRLIAVPAGVAVAYLGVFGLPPFPPVASNQTLFYILAGGGVALAVLFLGRTGSDGGSPLRRAAPLVAGVIVTAAVFWLISNLIGRLAVTEWLMLGILLLGLYAFIAVGFANDSSAIGVRAVAGIIAATLGILLILGETASIGFLALALAVTMAATLFGQMPSHASYGGPALAAGAVIALAPLLAQALFLSDASKLALLPLAFVVFAIPVAARLGWTRPDSIGRVLWDSIRVAALAAVPAVIAIAIAYLSQEGGGGGGSPYG